MLIYNKIYWINMSVMIYVIMNIIYMKGIIMNELLDLYITVNS